MRMRLLVAVLAARACSSFVAPPAVASAPLQRFSRGGAHIVSALPPLMPLASALASLPAARWGAVAAGAAVHASHQLDLRRREREGQPLWKSTLAATRRQWSVFVRDTEGWLYAIQTLRNVRALRERWQLVETHTQVEERRTHKWKRDAPRAHIERSKRATSSDHSFGFTLLST